MIAAAPDAVSSAQVIRQHRRVLAAAMIGTAIEYYDFFIYGTAAALFFGKLFFPASDPGMQTLLAFLTFGIAFIARPVGAVLFGHFGDRYGRKSTLVAALLLMGLSTMAIAFLPTYAAIGVAAPVLLCLLRVGQGLGMGGEWAGAALLATENAPRGWEGRFGVAPQFGVPLGFIAANGGFLLMGLLLDEQALFAWGWRVPFLFSAALVILGLWMRLKLVETPEYRAALAETPPERVPVAKVLSRHGGSVLAGSLGAVICYSVFYLATSFALAEATGKLGYERNTFLGVQIVSALFLAAANLIAAHHADRTSPRHVLMLGGLGTVLAGMAFGPGLASGSLWIAGAMLCATMIVMGYANTTLAPWLGSLFPVRVRYTGVALSHNVGGLIGGALVPNLAQWLSARGMSGYTGWLLAATGVLTVIGTLLSRRRILRG